MTTPDGGYIPILPNRGLPDRFSEIYRMIRDLQKNVAGATTAQVALPLADTAPLNIADVALAGGLGTVSRADHVHASTLNAQSDVLLTAPASNDLLMYTGTSWINQAGWLSSATPTSAGGPASAGSATAASRGDHSHGVASPAYARYAMSTAGLTVASGGAVTPVAFQTPVVTNANVVASGVGNTTFTLQPGNWIVVFTVRWGTGAGTAGTVQQLLVLDGAGNFIDENATSYFSFMGPLSVASNILVSSATAYTFNVFQNSSASRTLDNSSAATAARTHVTFTRIST